MVADPIRLALVITELAPGGAERCLVELATRLDRSRYRPVVYSLGPRPAEGRRQLVKRLADAEIATHFLDLQVSRQFFGGARRLSQLLRQQQAEIVQTFLFHANVLGARAARLAGVPHFLTGLRVADPRRWRLLVERWATAAAARHVCVSRSVADFYGQRGFAANRLVVIPNGIDLARWQAARPLELTALGMPPSRKALVFVGRLEEQKGLESLFRELPAVFRELPAHDLLLVGAGPQRRQLEDLARQLQIAVRVHFTGWRADVPEILAASELLVLPSQWEGMPNVILEAMAAGKPVVATRAHGVTELLGDFADEQTTALGQPAEFARRLIELSTDVKRQKILASRNLERVIQQFSIENSVSGYDQLYRDILGRCA